MHSFRKPPLRCLFTVKSTVTAVITFQMMGLVILWNAFQLSEKLSDNLRDWWKLSEWSSGFIIRWLASLYSLLPQDNSRAGYQSSGKQSPVLQGLLSCSLPPIAQSWFVKHMNRVMMRAHEISAQPVMMERTSFHVSREAASYTESWSFFLCKYTVVFLGHFVSLFEWRKLF